MELELKVIDCEDYIYVANTDRWSSYDLSRYLFDGKHPQKTNKKEWYRLENVPKEIQQKQSPRQVNVRYELKAGYVATDLMPAIIIEEEYKSSDAYDDIINLYNRKYDEEDGGYETIEFKIDVIYKRKDFEFVSCKYPAQTGLITQIEYPEEAYQDKPCKITPDEMFELIRARVKKDLDTRYARIISDYDFHFEVKKCIESVDPYTIRRNINLGYKRKPKWVTDIISSKEETILNIVTSSDRGRFDAKCPPEIVGENYNDLAEKVDKYLDDLMKEINKNYCECPNCKGWGVVEVTEDGEDD